ncbi:MAG: transcription antitermination factor NusB [Deltaproteobacteria bacterium]|nr:MAG: transcription antitermination factor NusB [Deltaproteobacteria bacterium]
MAGKTSRRKERQFAFQVLYSINFADTVSPNHVDTTFDHFLTTDCEDGQEAAMPFARTLVQGVMEHLDELDATIARFSKHWKLSRIAQVELTILRLGVFEMSYVPDVPVRVAINEAIELSKEFGDDNSRNFINGILDGVGKELTESS